MKNKSKLILLLYFVLQQSVFGANGIDRQNNTATKKCGNPESDFQSYRTRRMVGGKDFKRGDFPWMVALTRKVRSKVPVFTCAGTLVSSRHVITGNNQH